jgi:hypothetical protein
MRYLNSYKIFEAKKSLVDDYLSKMGTTRQDVIDVFQNIVDLGYQPEFRLFFLNKDGRGRDSKKLTAKTAQETPLLLISFKSNKEKYVGRSQRFSNLEYLESLYHCLSMFMSMFKDKCNIEYDLDNYVELELRCKFETEYDDTKLSISRDEISDVLHTCLSLVPQDYTSRIEIDDFTRQLKLNAKPNTNVGQKLLDELNVSKTEKYISNLDEVEKIGKDISEKLIEELSKKFNKKIIIKKDSRGKSYITEDNLNNQVIATIKVGTNYHENKIYKANIKRGFLKTDKCEIELESLELTIEIP